MSASAEGDERELRVALMRAVLGLKTKQAFWETPRNIVLIVSAAAAAAGVLGFKLGQNSPPQTIVVQLPSTAR